ncbi:MAG: hypothetical protein KAR39_12785 [Thermoplasmata archaeon]|nr:hypothetical protein [Thermoplasmata archaeon]
MTKMLSETEIRELMEKLEKEGNLDPHLMGRLYYRGMVRILKFVVGDTEGYITQWQSTELTKL